MAKIIITLPKGEKVEYELPDKGEVIIGRAADADVRVEVSEVSRRHAKIYCEDGKVYIEDLGSRNGTFVNKQRLVPGERKLIRQGDKITLANTVKLELFSEETVAVGEETQFVSNIPPSAPKHESTQRIGIGVFKVVDAPKDIDIPEEIIIPSFDGDEATFIFGRSESADFVIPDPYVSSEQAKLIIKKEGKNRYKVEILDLAATNPTIVNKRSLKGEKASLRKGSIIQLGRVKLKFEPMFVTAAAEEGTKRAEGGIVPPPPPPAKKTNFIPYIAGLIGVGILAVLLFVVVPNKKGGESGSGGGSGSGNVVNTTNPGKKQPGQNLKQPGKSKKSKKDNKLEERINSLEITDARCSDPDFLDTLIALRDSVHKLSDSSIQNLIDSKYKDCIEKAKKKVDALIARADSIIKGYKEIPPEKIADETNATLDSAETLAKKIGYKEALKKIKKLRP